MTSRNKRIAGIAALLLGIVVVIALVFVIHGCDSDDNSKGGTPTKTHTTDTTTTADTESTAADDQRRESC